MTTAINAASYIASKKSLNGEMQLQKLLYYAQAWSLAWDGTPLFSDRIEAWRMGPVVPSVRYVSTTVGDASALTEAQKATIDAVLEHYGNMTGGALGNLTHVEDPWIEAWDKRQSETRCDEEITHNAMRRFYTRQALAHKGPKRQPVARESVSDDEIMAIAKANSQIWSHTLELLAR